MSTDIGIYMSMIWLRVSCSANPDPMSVPFISTVYILLIGSYSYRLMTRALRGQPWDPEMYYHYIDCYVFL